MSTRVPRGRTRPPDIRTDIAQSDSNSTTPRLSLQTPRSARLRGADPEYRPEDLERIGRRPRRRDISHGQVSTTDTTEQDLTRRATTATESSALNAIDEELTPDELTSGAADEVRTQTDDVSDIDSVPTLLEETRTILQQLGENFDLAENSDFVLRMNTLQEKWQRRAHDFHDSEQLGTIFDWNFYYDHFRKLKELLNSGIPPGSHASQEFDMLRNDLISYARRRQWPIETPFVVSQSQTTVETMTRSNTPMDTSPVRPELRGVPVSQPSQGYVIEHGEQKKILAWRKQGRGFQFLLHSTPEGGISLYELVRVSIFGGGALEAYRRSENASEFRAENYTSLQTTSANELLIDGIASPRRNEEERVVTTGSRSWRRNVTMYILTSLFHDDRKLWYRKSDLARKFGAHIVEEAIVEHTARRGQLQSGGTTINGHIGEHATNRVPIIELPRPTQVSPRPLPHAEIDILRSAFVKLLRGRPLTQEERRVVIAGVSRQSAQDHSLLPLQSGNVGSVERSNPGATLHGGTSSTEQSTSVDATNNPATHVGDISDSRARSDPVINRIATARTLNECNPLTESFTFLSSLTDDSDASCPICMNPYMETVSEEWPVQLPCRHIMGNNCVARWIKDSGANRRFHCPMCRCSIPVRGLMSALLASSGSLGDNLKWLDLRYQHGTWESQRVSLGNRILSIWVLQQLRG